MAEALSTPLEALRAETVVALEHAVPVMRSYYAAVLACAEATLAPLAAPMGAIPIKVEPPPPSEELRAKLDALMRESLAQFPKIKALQEERDRALKDLEQAQADNLRLRAEIARLTALLDEPPPPVPARQAEGETH